MHSSRQNSEFSTKAPMHKNAARPAVCRIVVGLLRSQRHPGLVITAHLPAVRGGQGGLDAHRLSGADRGTMGRSWPPAGRVLGVPGRALLDGMTWLGKWFQ